MLTTSTYLNLTVLTAMLPLAFAWLATTLAGLLSQDKWPGYVNDIIATVFVILASIADVYLTGKLTGDIALIVGTVTATATLLLATSFVPLQKWTAMLQSTILVLEDSGFHFIATQPSSTTTAAIPTPVFAVPATPEVPPTNADSETTEVSKQQFIQASVPPTTTL